MKKQFKGKVFDERTDEDYREKCESYLERLPTTNLPFDCRNLRRLPEAIKLIHSNKPSTTYQHNDLICLYNVKNELSRRCGINSVLKSDREGNLIFRCLKDGEKIFKVRLIDFEKI